MTSQKTFREFLPSLIGYLISLLPVTDNVTARAVDFSRDIQPILSQNCFSCHGPDDEARKAGLRLDLRQAAIESGAISPANVEGSDLILRILSTDPDERMPPADSQRTLTKSQQQLLIRWIKEGAQYNRHWSFLPPQRPVIPEFPPGSPETGWVRTQIDNFILDRIKEAGIEPSPAADRYTLVRRLHLDLIGLPPAPEVADAFVRSNDPQAYERLVDRLLHSTHYGEHWARAWLDLARYSDTNGYEKDRPRSMWPYRDWVIRALNDDMPFDQFTIEQLAGDMLPAATSQQRIATGFHRNTMINEEGGIDPLEYRFYAMVDRVATTGTVWLGLTVGCAQCHTHKYDPISHTDYYRLMALLNNADEPDLIVSDANSEAARQEIARKISQLEADLPSHFPPDDSEGTLPQRRHSHFVGALDKWTREQGAAIAPWKVLEPVGWHTNLPLLEVQSDGSIFASGDFTKRDEYTITLQNKDSSKTITALRLEALPDDRLPAGGPGRAYYEGRKGDFFLSEITVRANGNISRFRSASRSYGKIAVGRGDAEAKNVFDGDGSTGWSTAHREGERHVLVLNFAEPLTAEQLEVHMIFERHFVAALGRFRFSVAGADEDLKALDMPQHVEKLLIRNPTTWSDEEQSHVESFFLATTPALAAARNPIDELRKTLPRLTTTMVMQERPDHNVRSTQRHHRGEYLSSKEEVTPGVPTIFPQISGDTPANRLALARWLVSEKNPLAARVTVNRAWRALMGYGLVRSDGDFGTQSEASTHPQLLGWLACEFIDQAWSMKALHRLIVTSSTYRQQSHTTEELLQIDPQNRLFARATRNRVTAEMVRDILLRTSGLLSSKIGGPSVYPPQPASVTALAYGGTQWNPSEGADRYRRSLYTFSKRTAPFAAYVTFDGPSGENCTARRDRSNTPLQALTLLNDPMFLEMARALAREAMKLESATPQQRANFIFRRLLTRRPTPQELARLISFQEGQLDRIRVEDLDANVIAGEANSSPELASWVMLTRVLMNLDETITKY